VPKGPKSGLVQGKFCFSRRPQGLPKFKRALWGDKPEGLLPENCPNFSFFFCLGRPGKLPHSVPKGPKSGRTSFKTRKGLVQGKVFSGKVSQATKSGKLKTRKGRASFKNLVIIKMSWPKQKKRKIGTIFWEQTFRFVTPKGPFKFRDSLRSATKAKFPFGTECGSSFSGP
jgi:hypothetical protein